MSSRLRQMLGGDRKALESSICESYYERESTPPAQRPKLAYNVALGMEKYGLIEKDATLTPLGEELLMLADDPVSMYRRFAKHILVELPGTLLLDAVRDMRAAGERITLPSLRQALSDRDVHTPPANKHMSLMRLWLDKAGVTTKAWQINEKLYTEILGVSQTELDALVDLTSEQRAILKVLAEVGTTVDSSKLRVATKRAFPVKLNEKAFSRLLKPLADAGFLSFQPARGKSAPVKPAPRLLRDVTGPLLDQYGKGLPAKLRTLLRRPLADIVAALDSTSGYEKGLALEALGFKMMRSIGLDYRDTRFRPKQRGAVRGRPPLRHPAPCLLAVAGSMQEHCTSRPGRCREGGRIGLPASKQRNRHHHARHRRERGAPVRNRRDAEDLTRHRPY